MTYIPDSENLRSKAERHKQRHLALRTVQNHDNGLELQINKSQISQKDRFIEFNFNENGYLETVEDNVDNIEEYIYDEAGWIINTRTNNDVNINLNIEYDKNGNATKTTPEEGKEHDFEYDLLDRVKTYTSPKVGTENNFPTLWMMKGPKYYNHKIRYPIILLP